MKYFLSLLALVAMTGAGCAQVSTTATTQTQDTQEPAPVAVEVSTDGEPIVTQEGSTTIDGNGVPTTEIILGEPADVNINLNVESFAFTPSTIAARPGDKVNVTFTNVKGLHTFVIDEAKVNVAVSAGESVIFTAPSEPGQYPFYCDIGSHRALGLIGTLVVE